MKSLTCKIIFLLCTLSLQASWQGATEVLSAQNGVDGYHFGSSVDLGKNFAVVGAPDEGVSGTIYIFKKEDNGHWTQFQKFTSPSIPQTVGGSLHVRGLGGSVAFAQKESFWAYPSMIVVGAAKSYYLDSQDRALDTGAICTYIYDSEHNQYMYV